MVDFSKHVKKRRERHGGIDPGKEGYMVAWDGCDVLRSDPIPWLGSDPDFGGILRIMLAWKKLGVVRVHLEEVETHGRENTKGVLTSGRGLGAIEMALEMVRIPYKKPRPAEWKKEMGISRKKPKKPRVPKEPKKPRAKAAQTTWQKEHDAWAVVKKEVDRKRRVIDSEHSKKLKDVACAAVRRLSPGIDLFKSQRCTRPLSGKAEALLLAEHSRLAG